RTNRKAGSQPIAMDELLDRRLMRPVVACCSCWMVLVERSILKYSLVNGTRRDEDEAANASTSCRFNQPQGSHNIPLDELNDVAFRTAESRSRSKKCGMNHRVASSDQRSGCFVVVEFTGQPL